MFIFPVSKALAEDLVGHIESVIPVLDSMADGYMSIHKAKEAASAYIEEQTSKEPKDLARSSSDVAMSAALAAVHWLSKSKADQIRKGRSKHPKRRGSIRHTC